MPKGQPPSNKMAARYSLLSKQLDNEPKDYSTFSKIRRKVNEFLGTDSGQLVTSERRSNLLRKVKKMEKNMMNMKERFYQILWVARGLQVEGFQKIAQEE